MSSPSLLLVKVTPGVTQGPAVSPGSLCGCRASHKGRDNAEDFLLKSSIRLNLALPRSRVEEAFDRLDKYVFNT